MIISANLSELRETDNKAANSAMIAANGCNTYGLCHGLAGIGEFIIETERVLKTQMNTHKNKILSLIISETVVPNRRSKN